MLINQKIKILDRIKKIKIKFLKARQSYCTLKEKQTKKQAN